MVPGVQIPPSPLNHKEGTVKVKTFWAKLCSSFSSKKRCHHCREVVKLKFDYKRYDCLFRDHDSNKPFSYLGMCPNCGKDNYLLAYRLAEKYSWAQERCDELVAKIMAANMDDLYGV